jgi:hypothetical protein
MGMAVANRTLLIKGARRAGAMRNSIAQQISILCVAWALAVGSALAEEATPVDSSKSPPTPRPDVSPPSIPSIGDSKSDFLADIKARKSYWIPAGEIIGFEVLLNAINRTNSDDYNSSMSSIEDNLGSSWNTDSDPFATNQLGHPYAGSIYHGFARSAGLNFWESLGYTVAGSAAWEIAGETSPPSYNDQISTGIGGSFLGEALFRMSNLVLEKANMSSGWRELSAALISPPTGFNRLAFGDRFDLIYPSGDAAYYGRVSLGVSTVTDSNSGTSANVTQNEGIVDFSLDYGLPGKPGYNYNHPFDLFAFKVTASTANGLENLMTRGLLVGDDYEAGKNYRGVWGLYGSFDYIEPQIYRVSSTALSLGTTAQWWLSKSIALQGSALAGVGYAAVGTVNGTTENDYNYGVAPQALMALRLIFGDRVALDTTTRGYFVKDVGGADEAGHDNIYRTDVAFTVRVYRQHAVSVRYLLNRRDTSSPNFGDRSQSNATVGLFYTFLGNDGFGVVEWRDSGAR